MIDSKSASKGLPSIEDFKREMTLVYLMLKGEYSKEKVDKSIDDVYLPRLHKCSIDLKKINEEPTISVQGLVEVSPSDIDKSAELLAPLEVSGVQGFVAVSISDSAYRYGQIESISVPIHQFSNSFQKPEKLTSPHASNIQGFVKVIPTDSAYMHEEIMPFSVSVRRLADIPQTTEQLPPSKVSSVQGLVEVSASDSVYTYGQIESVSVHVPIFSNSYRKTELLPSPSVNKVRGLVEVSASDSAYRCEQVEPFIVQVRELSNISKKVIILTPSIIDSVQGLIIISPVEMDNVNALSTDISKIINASEYQALSLESLTSLNNTTADIENLIADFKDLL